MTYAGFKSLLYAGMDADDVRVRAAFDWIRRHWTFDENPGMKQDGLFYYYHAMARALNIAQQSAIGPLLAIAQEDFHGRQDRTRSPVRHQLFESRNRCDIVNTS